MAKKALQIKKFKFKGSTLRVKKFDPKNKETKSNKNIKRRDSLPQNILKNKPCAVYPATPSTAVNPHGLLVDKYGLCVTDLKIKSKFECYQSKEEICSEDSSDDYDTYNTHEEHYNQQLAKNYAPYHQPQPQVPVNTHTHYQN